jgi:hypothetical protein
MVPTLLHHERSIADEANTPAIVVSREPKSHQEEKTKEKLKKSRQKRGKNGWEKVTSRKKSLSSL